MPEDIQSLLEKIQSEGIAIAEREKERILSEARAKASEIIENAKKQADEILKKANAEAELTSKRAIEGIKQASRDILITLRNEMHERIKRIIKDNLSAAMTPELMAQIVVEIVRSGKKAEDLKIILPQKNLETLSAALKSSLAKDLKANPIILSSNDFSAGLKIGFKGDDVLLDFSDEALVDIISIYAGARIAELLKS